MEFLIDSFLSAILLLWSRNPEVYFIIYVSLKVSLSSTLIASILGVPAGFFIAVPTVVVGLLVYAFISRRGLLGILDLLYTQKAMIIGQVILILPIVASLTIAAISQIDYRYRKTAMTLGATPFQTALVVFREARFGIMAAIITSFGRVISEIGISMMLGGNAKGYTRTMTTAMALEYDKGEFVLGVALGIVLLLISFTINIFFNYLQGRSRA